MGRPSRAWPAPRPGPPRASAGAGAVPRDLSKRIRSVKRLVSLSLYGTAPLYLHGALRNVRLVPRIYPGWTARVYASQEVPADLKDAMRAEGAEVIDKDRSGAIDGMFWRFLPAGEPDIDAVVVRDADSRITVREYAAVSEWIDSGKTIHILRDHPGHDAVMLGGMWGCRHGAIPDIATAITRWARWDRRGQDQDFLREMVYSRFRNDCLVHSEVYAYGEEVPRPFPMPRTNGEFVGCVYESDRDCLTEDQIAESREHFEHRTLRRLPYSPTRPRLAAVVEHWARALHKRVTSA